MRHSIIFPASAALLLTVGGCGGTQNRGLESVHQPVVETSDYALDLRTAGGSLAAGEPGRLSGWFDAIHLGYGDRVSVDASGVGADGERAEVAGLVAAYGLLVTAEPASSLAPVEPGAVRVVVTRARASVPGCPDWSRDSANDFGEHTSSNFGCAMIRNLAAMVASPADLVRGRAGLGTNDPSSVSKTVDTYRKQALTGAAGLKSDKAGGK